MNKKKEVPSPSFFPKSLPWKMPFSGKQHGLLCQERRTLPVAEEPVGSTGHRTTTAVKGTMVEDDSKDQCAQCMTTSAFCAANT